MFLPGSLQGSCRSRQRLSLWGVPGNSSHRNTCPLLSPPPGRVRNLRPWGMQALSPLSVVSQGKQTPPTFATSGSNEAPEDPWLALPPLPWAGGRKGMPGEGAPHGTRPAPPFCRGSGGSSIDFCGWSPCTVFPSPASVPRAFATPCGTWVHPPSLQWFWGRYSQLSFCVLTPRHHRLGHKVGGPRSARQAPF